MASTSGRALLLVGLLASQPGCWGWIRVNAGAVTSTTLRGRRQGVAIGEDIAFGDKPWPVAIDLGVQAKVTPAAGDLAWTLALLHYRAPDPVAPYVLGGAHLFDIGSADGALTLGALSPFAEAGIAWAPGNPREGLLTLGSRIEYDLRFTSRPHEGFWTVNVGWAIGDGKR